jgi:hypothetical protein
MDTMGVWQRCQEAYSQHGWHMHSGMRASWRVILPAIVTVVAGCGGSVMNERSYRMPSGGRITPPTGSYVLVRKPWRTGGGRFLIVAEYHRYHGKDEFEISTYGESPGFRGMFPSGGGLLTGSEEDAALVMDVQRDCKGSSEHGLAYGLLRRRQDTVTGRESGARIVFSEVRIPARFHAGGVLVYAQVGRAPTDVVTQAPNGRIVSNTTYVCDLSPCD